MSTTAISESVVHDLGPPQQAVERRLDVVRRRVRLQILLEGVAWMLGVLVILAALSLLADWSLRLSLSTRLSLIPLGLFAVLAVGYWRLARPMAVKLEDMDLAMLLDRHRPGVAQRVATVLQLPNLLSNGFSASPSIVRAAVLEDAAALEQTNFTATLDTARLARFLCLLAAIFLAPATFAVCFPATAELWYMRWLCRSTVPWPQMTHLWLHGLDHDRMLVPRGEPLVLQVTAPEFKTWADTLRQVDAIDDPASRRWLDKMAATPIPANVVPNQVSLRYRTATGSTKQANFTQFGENDFRYELPPVQERLQLTITGGDDRLGPITIEPIDRPTITKLELKALLPGRSEAETHTFQGSDTQLLFLRKTELELHITASVPLASASLRSKTGPAPAFERLDSQNYSARWTMSEPLVLEVQLLSEQQVTPHVGLASKPYVFSIGVLKDREPRVTIRSSGVGPRVTPMARLPITARSLDDFGLTALALEMDRVAPTAGESEEKEKPEPKRIDLDVPESFEATEAERQHTVALRELGPQPGTLIKLRGLAVDNCAEGEQTGYSRWLSFRVVSAEELFHEILMRQRAERAKFTVALNTAKAQLEALETLVAAEELDGVVRKHQVVERTAWQVANRLDESLTEMTLNELGTSQAIELLQSRVITPLRQLHADQMSDMRKALDRLVAAKSDLEPQLPPARELQRQIVTAMEKILEQMSQWESFVDVVNQLREVMKLQNRVLESTEDVRKKRTKGLFDE